MALQEAAGQLSNVIADNCAALYLFDSISNMLAFARAHPFTQPEALPEATTDFSWILALRGIRTIFFSSCENLRSGPLAPMVRGGDDREQQWQQPGKHPHLDELRKAVTAATNDSHDAIIILMQQEFNALLKVQRQETLVIFGYGCVLFKYLDSYWWLEGWGVRLIAQVYAMLDEERRPWIRRPLEQM
ncbi:hypothetical protein DL95DRAFT_407203 [Leptodontidium sp. 2 PMI_412]|nr:hypothetical protein DL95DRAFT_407203 [Leptodontidium sp. 2 PMI_412]